MVDRYWNKAILGPCWILRLVFSAFLIYALITPSQQEKLSIKRRMAPWFLGAIIASVAIDALCLMCFICRQLKPFILLGSSCFLASIWIGVPSALLTRILPIIAIPFGFVV